MTETGLVEVLAPPQVNPPPAELALAHLDELPSPSPLLRRLFGALGDPMRPSADALPLLREDPGLLARAAALTRAGAGVNAAPPPPAPSPEHVADLQASLVALCIHDTFGNTPESADAFDVRGYWCHAFATAGAARRLASTASVGVDARDAYLAGLLHDVGKLALGAVYPRASARLAQQARQSRGDLVAAERAALGIDHTVAGRHLVERWGLPRTLRDATWLHHLAADALPPSAVAPRLIVLVRLADAVVRELLSGAAGNFSDGDDVTELSQLLGIRSPQVSAAGAGLAEEARRCCACLLDGPAATLSAPRALQSANRELQRSNSELRDSNQRLRAAERCLMALAKLHERVAPETDCGTLVVEIARAACTALACESLAAFGLHPDGAAHVGACFGPTGACVRAAGIATLPVGPWQQAPSHPPDPRPAPAAMRALLGELAGQLGSCELWMLPLRADDGMVGGLVFCADEPRLRTLRSEASEIGAFLTGIGRVLSWAAARSAGARFSEELAESNRSLQRTRADALRSRTLNMLAEMAAGAGHELNGPLSVIAGRAQMLQESAVDPATARVLQTIDAKARECSQVVSDLMEIARPAAPRLERVDVQSLLEAARAAWLAECAAPPDQVRVEPAPRATDPSRATLLADRVQLSAVITELLRNASAALPSVGGLIRVAWAAAPPLTPQLASAAGAAIEITVRDNGGGMEASVLRRAFDPFFSHRAAGRRRGLGLARAHRVIEAHGGRILLESEPGTGTTARILLPTAAGERRASD